MSRPPIQSINDASGSAELPAEHDEQRGSDESAGDYDGDGDAHILSLPLETRREIEGMLHWVAREAQFGAWSAAIRPDAAYGSLCLISISGKLLAGEVEEPFSVCRHPSRRTISGELVRIDFDEARVESCLSALTSILCRGLEPFIIGVGEIRARQTTNGLVILRRNVG
jgi:hypothetical protein